VDDRAVERVAAGGEVGENQEAELIERPRQPRAAQPQGEGVDVSSCRKGVGGVHLTARNRRVA